MEMDYFWLAVQLHLTDKSDFFLNGIQLCVDGIQKFHDLLFFIFWANILGIDFFKIFLDRLQINQTTCDVHFFVDIFNSVQVPTPSPE